MQGIPAGSRLVRLFLLTVTPLVSVNTGCSGGGSYPNRPILLICPWAAGGGSDRIARQAAALLQRELGVNVDVQNTTGGEGVTGHSAGALSTPDGYTLTLMTVEINMLRWRGRTKLSYRDFEPVLLLNRDPAGIFVHRDAPWRSLKELEAEIRAKPGLLRASGTASGGIWHLALAGWLQTAGLKPSDVTWVASTGSTPALRDLLARGIEAVACSPAEAKTMVKNGDIRCLGVMAEVRHPLFPEVPTFRELGVDWAMGAWRGIGAPLGTPKRVLDVLVPALEKVALSEAYKTYMDNEGFGMACEGPAAFSTTLERTDVLMKNLLTQEAFRSLSRSAIGAMLFPSVLGAGLLAVLLGLFFAKEKAVVNVPATTGARWRFAGAAAWVLGYMVLSGPLGYLLTTALLVFVLFWRLGTRPLPAALGAAALALSTYLLFAKILHVALPRGIQGF